MAFKDLGYIDFFTPVRHKILLCILNGYNTKKSIYKAIPKIAGSTIYGNIEILEKKGYIIGKQDGRTKFYSIKADNSFMWILNEFILALYREAKQ